MVGCVLLLAAACGGDTKSPTGLGGGPVGPPGIGGGGGGGETGSDLLIGQWRNSLLILVGADVQRIETTWKFDPDARCSRTVETFSVLEDRIRFSVRDCSYQAGVREIAVLYDDAQQPVMFDYSFPEFTEDRLVIGQFEFLRLF